jgi:hypothetical protein
MVISTLKRSNASTVNADLNTQTFKCQNTIDTGGYWTPAGSVIPCEPVTCQPFSSPNGSKLEMIVSPDQSNRQFQTKLLFRCPDNATLPESLKSNFSFDYKLAFGFVYNVSVSCDVDG